MQACPSQPQLMLPRRFRGTEGHWRGLSVLQQWEAWGTWEELKAWGRMACWWRHKEEMGQFSKRHRGYGVQVCGKSLPALAEHLSHCRAPGLSVSLHTSSWNLREVAIHLELSTLHDILFLGVDKAVEINQVMHKFTDSSLRRLKKWRFWLYKIKDLKEPSGWK